MIVYLLKCDCIYHGTNPTYPQLCKEMPPYTGEDVQLLKSWWIPFHVHH